MKCAYCLGSARLVKGTIIYPHIRSLHNENFWFCKDCKAWVGCHKGTTNSLGRLANAELRKLKSLAHSTFDPIWREGDMSRSDAYKWLATQLEMTKQECHIGKFDVEQCKAVIYHSVAYMESKELPQV